MRKIDYISKAPQLFIFRNEANQNNLGGILFLIYLIILSLLSIVYFYEYINNEKYQINYNLIMESYDSGKIKNKNLKKDDKLNVELEVIFSLAKDRVNQTINGDNFVIMDFAKEEKIPYNIPYKINTGNFSLFVFYICDLENCTIRKEDKIEERSYYLHMDYKGFILNHQDPNEPIKRSDKYTPMYIEFLSNTYVYYLNWELIEYEEEKGVFSKNFDSITGKINTYYGGHFKSKQAFLDDGHVREFKFRDKLGNRLMPLLYLEIQPNYYQHDKYTRKGKSLLYILADIAALGSTIFNLMTTAFGFLYSKNYNNYKIVEDILSNKMGININQELENNKEQIIEFKTDSIDNKDQNTEEKEDSIDTLNSSDKEIQNNKINRSIKYPLIKFYDFLVNKLYLKYFGHSDKQTFINSCNDVLKRYASMENLIYNQIRLESLFKDYKWNNRHYDIQEKNEFINQLQEK